tara:strand:+ start:352 stop:666 length:315 start_codon:yes stop_codon:yes gene_type:complete
MNRANIIFCSFALFCFLIFSCSTAKKTNTVEPECKLVSGKIVDMSSLDGCRYLIQLKDSSFLEPINLSDDYKIDKKEICFQYKLKPEIPSICMKGKIIEILKLE